jgi:hypothetical protein
MLIKVKAFTPMGTIHEVYIETSKLLYLEKSGITADMRTYVFLTDLDTAITVAEDIDELAKRFNDGGRQ